MSKRSKLSVKKIGTFRRSMHKKRLKPPNTVTEDAYIDLRITRPRHGCIYNEDVVMVLNAVSKIFIDKRRKNDAQNANNRISETLRYIDSRNVRPEIFKENSELLRKRRPQVILQEQMDDDSESPRLMKMSKVSSEEMLSNRIASTIRVNTTMNEYALNQNTLKKVNGLRYREEVFMAASGLTKDLPPYPPWSYKKVVKTRTEITKINVGGQIFEIFNGTVSNMCYTKVGKLLHGYNEDNVPFIDRDPVCFNAILNLYRTGRLHVPPNTCLTFFEDELEFWGINEDFIEACCWGDFNTSLVAGSKLKKYSEDSDKTMDKYDQNENKTTLSKFKMKIFKIMTLESDSTSAKWVGLLCAFFIIAGIVELIFTTTPIGRIDIKTGLPSEFVPEESVTHFLTRTKVKPEIERFDLCACGFFTAELLVRFIMCPVKLEFFRDSFNWIDIIATVTSLVVAATVKEHTPGKLQAYTLILKIPRIFRLLKLTPNLRSGIDAFVLTIIASANELQFVFFILLMVTVLFACLIFSVEMLDTSSTITSLYLGMWWAIETLPGVGYGDYIPCTVFGKIIGTMCIMLGVMVCQMPVPVFLKNFSVYYNQASARLVSQTNLLLFKNVDKSDIGKIEDELEKEQKSGMTDRVVQMMRNI